MWEISYITNPIKLGLVLEGEDAIRFENIWQTLMILLPKGENY
jgi:hypothetical protein